ncbi:MAG: glycosyltransferase family 2 protein [Alphaproteobacteria bacterium]|nr:glycosyltransferase family 2 protein [Alphaproteobacteria bacterium SS10]
MTGLQILSKRSQAFCIGRQHALITYKQPKTDSDAVLGPMVVRLGEDARAAVWSLGHANGIELALITTNALNLRDHPDISLSLAGNLDMKVSSWAGRDDFLEVISDLQIDPTRLANAIIEGRCDWAGPDVTELVSVTGLGIVAQICQVMMKRGAKGMAAKFLPFALRQAKPLWPPVNNIGGALENAVISPDGKHLVTAGWLTHPTHDDVRLLLGFTGMDPLKCKQIERFPRREVGSFLRANWGGTDADNKDAPDHPFKGVSKAPGDLSECHGVLATLSAAHPLPIGGQASWAVSQTGEQAPGMQTMLFGSPSPTKASANRLAVARMIPTYGLSDEIMERAIHPIMSAWHAKCLSETRTEVVREYGKGPASPAVSVVIPIYRDMRYLRQLLLAIARSSKDVEFIIVQDEPDDGPHLHDELLALQRMAGLSTRLVVQNTNGGFSTAVNAGAAIAKAPILAILNSDLLPADRRSLPSLIGALVEQEDIGVVGARLLFPDGGLQHAGMTFRMGMLARYYNAHYFKGLPDGFANSTQSRAMPAVTGACWAVRRDLWEEMGGLCTDYIIGNFEDSDFCLRLHQRGYKSWYCAESRWYHFENQSIARADSQAKTGTNEYNRWLQHHRWRSVIDDLVADPAFSDNAVA